MKVWLKTQAAKGNDVEIAFDHEPSSNDLRMLRRHLDMQIEWYEEDERAAAQLLRLPGPPPEPTTDVRTK
jgi:hypothetical protein